MKEIDITNFLDDRNSPLWESLSTQYDISLENTTKPVYHVVTKGRQATIYIPGGDASKEAFTHELLHIFIRSKGCYIYTTLCFKILGIKPLQNLGIETYLWEICNNLEHQKMLPIYLQMGFERDLFIKDFREIPFNVKEINYISEENLHGPYWREVTAIYLSSFFSIKASPNTSYNCQSILTGLQEAAPILYAIIDDFWNIWISLDVEDFRDNSLYPTAANTFTDGLREWVEQLGIGKKYTM